MVSINTVSGAVDVSQLGVTLMHEHIFVLSTEIMQNFPEAWGDEEQRIADAVARMNELKARGVDTVVDLTVIGLGRYIPRIQRIAEQTAINIIVATGVYTYNDVPFYFHFQGPGTILGGEEVDGRNVRPRHRTGELPTQSVKPEFSVRPIAVGSDSGLNESCARRLTLIGERACRFRLTRTRTPNAAWSSKRFSRKKVLTFLASSLVTAETPPTSAIWKS